MFNETSFGESTDVVVRRSAFPNEAGQGSASPIGQEECLSSGPVIRLAKKDSVPDSKMAAPSFW